MIINKGVPFGIFLAVKKRNQKRKKFILILKQLSMIINKDILGIFLIKKKKKKNQMTKKMKKHFGIFFIKKEK
jgi:hypothetical protein